jgi:hypothetical protein
VCIDIEPDDRECGEGALNDWEGFEKTFEFFEALRPKIEAATGNPVNFSWFVRMDPQVERAFGSTAWAATRYPHLLEQIEKQGDALGVHIHPFRWDETSSGWITDLADQDWIDHCIRSGFESFEKALGRPCRYVRLGDGWVSDAALSLCESLGAQFDLTLEPGMIGGLIEVPAGRFSGALPDLTGIPRRPYRPSRDDFRKDDRHSTRRLHLVPLSSAALGPPAQPARATITNPALLDAANSMRSESPGISFTTYEGCHDTADSDLISGWVLNTSQPDHPVDVDIYSDDELLATVTANLSRPDLAEVGKGDGYHGFAYPVLSKLKDGKPHWIRVRVAGTEIDLNLTPKEICSPQRIDPFEQYFTLNLSCNSALFCQAFNDILRDSRTNYVAMVVRSDVVLHRSQTLNLERSLNHILRHAQVKKFAFDTPKQALKQLSAEATDRHDNQLFSLLRGS